MNVSGVVDAVMVACCTVSVTGIVMGLPVVPAEVIVTVPLYILAASPVGLTVTVTTPGVLPVPEVPVLPEVMEAESQVPLAGLVTATLVV